MTAPATAPPQAAYQRVYVANLPTGYSIFRFGRSAQYKLQTPSGRGNDEVFFTLHAPGSSEFGSLVAWLIVERRIPHPQLAPRLGLPR